MQLRVYQSESITHVRKRYRYPYFIPMLWYVAERLVRRATGRCYLADIKSTPLLEAEPTIRSSDSRTSSADSQLVDPDYVATDGSLMDTSTDSFVVVDDVAADEKATDAALKLPSHTASLPESSQASLTTSGTAPSCSSPPRLERADTEERKAVGAEEGNPGSRQTAPGDRLPFALNSPAFSSTNESEGEDNRKLPPPPIEPFSPTQNIPVSEREPFTPANKFDDNYLTSLTQFERDGINALMQFLMKLTEKNREVGEGILEPDHILKDLQCTFTRVCELKDNPSTSSTPVNQAQEPIDQENNEKPPIVDVPSKKATPPPSSKKSPAAAPKRARLSGPSGAPSASSAPSAAAKKPKKKKQSDAKEKSTTPPPPSPVVPAKFHGFDPMSELVALGHKPLPTAFRMGPNMATAPSVQRSILHRPKPLDTTGSGEVSSADHGSQISPSSDGRDPSTPTSQSSAFSALPIVHRQKQPQQQQLHDPSWPPTSAPIRPGDPRRQAALHQQQILRAALTAESPMMAGNYAARGILPHATTSFDHARPQFRPPNYYHSPSAITSASHMQHHNPHQQHQQQLAHHGYRPGFLPQPVPPPSLHSVPSPMNAVLFGSMPYQPVAISVDGAGSTSSAYHLEGGQQRSPQLPSPQSRPPQHHGLPPYTPLSQRSQGAPQVSPLLAGTPSPTATTSQPAHFGGGFFAPPSVMSASVSASKRQSLSSAEQFPMGPPKLLIPHLATTQPSAGVEATDRPRKSQLMSPKEEGKLEGQATINALDELTRALKNEPSPPSKQAEAKEDAPEEPTAGGDPLSWADELASLTQVMTEN
uniref:Jumonji helical domain-containing protein n=1 Tax=Plectus sambesii TaxID=2011161 RepID=A0A914UQC1_9BILA